MTDLEIGEYKFCAHGSDGKSLSGCIPCALEWHTNRQASHAEQAERHLKMLRRLEDELINRKMASAMSEESPPPPTPEGRRVIAEKD